MKTKHTPTDHVCGTPDAMCDTDCMRTAGDTWAMCDADTDRMERAAIAIEGLTDDCLALVATLKKCIASFEDMGEAMPMDAGCIQCTAGTVPNNLNTGLCGYHAAKGLLEPRT